MKLFRATWSLGACLTLLLFLALAGSSLAAADAAAPPQPKYILFLTADGFRNDYLEWYLPPTLRQFVAEGVRVKQVRNVFPTLTTPNMTSLVTGSYPRTTGIAANSQYVAEQDKIVKAPRDNKARTIAEMLGEAGWKTAGVNHFMLQGRGVDFYVAPGYDESEKTTDAVLETLKKGARFVGAIYGATDHAGHAHGPKSREVEQTVLGIDKAVGRLMEGLKAMGIYEQTLICFNSDHGMSAYESKQVSIEPAEALRKVGFRVATSPAELKSDTQLVVIDAGVRLVYFRGKLTREEKEKVKRVLAGIQGAQVLDRAVLDRLGCHNNRSGDLVVSPLPGFTMSRAGARGGLHGRFSERNPVLIFRGPGVKAGVTVNEAETVDIVPTLLRQVNVPPARTVDGKPIAGL